MEAERVVSLFLYACGLVCMGEVTEVTGVSVSVFWMHGFVLFAGPVACCCF